jgi:cytochrome c peroxidase
MKWLVLLLVVCGCANRPSAETTPFVSPEQNAKVNLGWRLFFDPILSGDKDRSCGTCHQPDRFMAGGRAHALSKLPNDTTLNNTPSILNLAQRMAFMWDGSAHSLEDQVRRPLFNPAEMLGYNIGPDSYEKTVLDRLRGNPSYRSWFRRAFPKDSEAVNIDNAATAIAEYERTLAGSKHWEQVEQTAFIKAGCAKCHSGPNFTDDALHRLRNERSIKTPSLLNCPMTAPYLHDGSASTLIEAVRAHNNLGLGTVDGRQLEELCEYLNSLTDTLWEETANPPAELTSGTVIGSELNK